MNDLSKWSDDELIALRLAVRSELKRRNISDTVGAVGEALAIRHFKETSGLPNLQLSPVGTKNVDALSRAGERYSIKTVCEGSKTGTIYPGDRDSVAQLFEYLLIVKLADDWTLESIHQFSWSAFLEARSWDKRMSAWYVAFNKRALARAIEIFRR